jgi:hypothetical protein
MGMASDDLRFCCHRVDVVNGVMMGIVLRFELFVEGIMIFDIVCLLFAISGLYPINMEEMTGSD